MHDVAMFINGNSTAPIAKKMNGLAQVQNPCLRNLVFLWAWQVPEIQNIRCNIRGEDIKDLTTETKIHVPLFLTLAHG
jgi:hypothetical protein